MRPVTVTNTEPTRSPRPTNDLVTPSRLLLIYYTSASTTTLCNRQFVPGSISLLPNVSGKIYFAFLDPPACNRCCRRTALETKPRLLGKDAEYLPTSMKVLSAMVEDTLQYCCQACTSVWNMQGCTGSLFSYERCFTTSFRQHSLQLSFRDPCSEIPPR
jgi:hypothetical protein